MSILRIKYFTIFWTTSYPYLSDNLSFDKHAFCLSLVVRLQAYQTSAAALCPPSYICCICINLSYAMIKASRLCPFAPILCVIRSSYRKYASLRSLVFEPCINLHRKRSIIIESDSRIYIASIVLPLLNNIIGPQNQIKPNCEVQYRRYDRVFSHRRYVVDLNT